MHIVSSGKKKLPGHVAISIVSHGQFGLVSQLLDDLEKVDGDNLSIVLTINIDEDISRLDGYKNIPITVIKNASQKGFGENHNFAFKQVYCDYFLIANPDIRLCDFDLGSLISPFGDSSIGAVAPVVLSVSGSVEDSARKFPTFFSLARKVLTGDGGGGYHFESDVVDVDWVAGMFVVYRAVAFETIGGFDEQYFMYYEDAEICRRMRSRGWRVVLQPTCSVVHDARRTSHKSLKYLRWHLTSVFRFLFLPGKAP